MKRFACGTKPTGNWQREAKQLPDFHQRNAELIATVNGDAAALEYVRAWRAARQRGQVQSLSSLT